MYRIINYTFIIRCFIILRILCLSSPQFFILLSLKKKILTFLTKYLRWLYVKKLNKQTKNTKSNFPYFLNSTTSSFKNWYLCFTSISSFSCIFYLNFYYCCYLMDKLASLEFSDLYHRMGAVICISCNFIAKFRGLIYLKLNIM